MRIIYDLIITATAKDRSAEGSRNARAPSSGVKFVLRILIGGNNYAVTPVRLIPFRVDQTPRLCRVIHHQLVGI
jgi:hypothetical protein